jgi:hypothetical protein
MLAQLTATQFIDDILHVSLYAWLLCFLALILWWSLWMAFRCYQDAKRYTHQEMRLGYWSKRENRRVARVQPKGYKHDTFA